MTETTPHRREAYVVAAMTLVGAVLRFWGPGRLGLNHFDEGIYAFAGVWSVSPKGLWSISPELVAYAPPLYPILVGIAYLFLGVTDTSAILVSQVAGILTIPAVAWVARRTFGRGAGAAASALCAISGPHIAFSRMALTDSTFLLCWVLALGVGGWFLERPGVWRAIVLGLIVGLAQNTKYNGYLAGGIVALTAVWGFVKPSAEGRRDATRAIAYGLIAAVVAMLVYWPWYRFVQSQPGGYAGLLKHHQGYLTGTTPRAWGEHWVLQLGQAASLAGTLTQGLNWGGAAWALAWIGGWFAATAGRDAAPSRWRGARSRIVLLLGIIVFGCGFNPQYFVALATAPFLLLDRRPSARVIAISWLTMAVLTPFYHPYARLSLPLHLAGWLLVAGLVVDLGPNPAAWLLSSRDRPRRERSVMFARRAALVVALAGPMIVTEWFEIRAVQIASPIVASDELKTACRSISMQMGASFSPPPRVLIVARPSVLFYLNPPAGVPLIRASSFQDAIARHQPGDYILVDFGLGAVRYPLSDLADSSRFNLVRMKAAIKEYHVVSPAPTWLDLYPGSPFDDQPFPLMFLRYYPLIELPAR